MPTIQPFSNGSRELVPYFDHQQEPNSNSTNDRLAIMSSEKITATPSCNLMDPQHEEIAGIRAICYNFTSQTIKINKKCNLCTIFQ